MEHKSIIQHLLLCSKQEDGEGLWVYYGVGLAGRKLFELHANPVAECGLGRLNAPGAETEKGKRDRAILATARSCNTRDRPARRGCR